MTTFPDGIRGSVDRFQPPGTLWGWAVNRRDGVLVGDLRVEAVRDGVVIASSVPVGPRPDVPGNGDEPAAFGLVCDGKATITDLLDGGVTLRAVDALGMSAVIPIWAPTRAVMRQEALLATIRDADPDMAVRVLDALAANGMMAGEAAEVLRLGRELALAAKTAAAVGPKIVLIGAGSTVFAKNLIGDILLHPALRGSRICLYDIDPERLLVSEIVAGRIRDTLGCSATIEATLDLGRALDGADYAITMIQVGGYEPATVIDFEIPKRFGLRQTIGDTLGIGGIMRGLRTIPVLLEIAQEMERRCPDVLHLNYANPMAMNCWALSRASGIRTVGLCHSVPLTAAEMARDIGVPAESVRYVVAGINHMAFFLRFTAGGEDLYPKLRRVIDEGRVPADNQVRYDMLRRLGYFVTESSEHFAEYVPWYIKGGSGEAIERLRIPLDEYPRRCRLQIAEWGQLSAALTRSAGRLDVQPSLEYGSVIINAVHTGRPAMVYGNVPNAGLISNLPEGCCVEVPCLVDANGVQPVRIGDLPVQLAALMQTNINVQALTVEAALTGRREHVYHAAMMDPHTASVLDLDGIWALVDAMLKAHREWLPAGYY